MNYLSKNRTSLTIFCTAIVAIGTGYYFSSRVTKAIVNKTTNAIANNIGVSYVIDPLKIVAIQLNTFTPVGIAISIVAHMKNSSATNGIPTVNIWWAQTTNESTAIDTIA